jgi:hypothetical protein
MRNVPVIDVHTRTFFREGKHGEKEKVEETVDEAQLYRIFENSMKRARDGEYGLVFLGHTDDEGPETKQPPIVGYIPTYRFGRHRGRPTILADVYLKRKYNPDLLTEQFPRRSVEIIGKNEPDGFIDSLAMLKRSPERDLGLITSLFKNNRPVERFMCPDCREEMAKMPRAMNPQMAKKSFDLFRDLMMMFLEEELGEGHHGGHMGGGEEEGLGAEEEHLGEEEEELGEEEEELGGEEEELGEEEEEVGEEEEGMSRHAHHHEHEEEEEEEEEETERYASYPSATSVSVPSGGHGGGGKGHGGGGSGPRGTRPDGPKITATNQGVSQGGGQRVKQEGSGPAVKLIGKNPMKSHITPKPSYHSQQARQIDRMYRDQDNIQISRFQKRINELENTVRVLTDNNEVMAQERKQSFIEARLIQLEAEGFTFDRPKHVERFMRLPIDALDDELAVIRENYTRSPVNQPFAIPVDATIDVGGNSLPEPARTRSEKEGIFGMDVVRYARQEKIKGSKSDEDLVNMVSRWRTRNKVRQTS